jgi:class 3 adenylate cyclase
MRLNLTQKIHGIALVILVLMAMAAIHSIRLTAVVSDDLSAISTGFLPVTEKVSRINVHVLEQGILLERMIIAIDEVDKHKSFVKTRKQFVQIGTLTVNEFEEALAILQSVIDTSLNTSLSIPGLIKQLDSIKAMYINHETHGLLLIDHPSKGSVDFDTKADDLVIHQDALDAAIADLRRYVEVVTNEAVDLANELEHELLITNILLTLTAAISGIGFAITVTRILMRAVQNLVNGTEAVESGDLDTNLEVISQDEVGRLTGSFNHMVGELRLKERIKDTFGKYMDPRIVNNLLDHPELSEPRGDRHEMTVLFIDLKGFTSISEALEPFDLVLVINNFFSHMTDAISDNNGVVDKFMGDAVMAYWGPPFNNAEEHATLACKAALSALDHLEKFREDVREKLGSKADDLKIDLRIGISTGDMIVGTIGSRASMNFTVMGDPVNLGARLEGANKTYGTHILISERTYEMAQQSIRCREIDLIRVMGKSKSTRIYEVSNEFYASVSFQSGIKLYRNQLWPQAISAFDAALLDHPTDTAAQVYLNRIAQLQSSPPSTDWDGVWNFETK